MENLVYELESFERDDVSQIHEYDETNPDEVGKTIWTEEEGLFISYGELDYEDEEDDGEYYSDGSELFSEETIPGVIDDLLINDDFTDDEEEKRVYSKMRSQKDDPKVLEELKELCVKKVCDNEKIINYISDFTISELGDMDGLWNEFSDILEDTIFDYFKN
jgi:hypothetical protein